MAAVEEQRFRYDSIANSTGGSCEVCEREGRGILVLMAGMYVCAAAAAEEEEEDTGNTASAVEFAPPTCSNERGTASEFESAIETDSSNEYQPHMQTRSSSLITDINSSSIHHTSLTINIVSFHIRCCLFIC